MIKKRIVTTQKEIYDEVTCDCCGKSCKVYEYLIDNPENPDCGLTEYVFEFIELKATWGYYSNKDGQKWVAQICESCVDTKLTVLINFEKSRYL